MAPHCFHRRTPPLIAALFALLTVALPAQGGGENQQATLPGENVDTARALIEQIVQTRQLISKEKAELRSNLETVQDRIDLARDQIQSLRDQIEERSNTNRDLRQDLENLEEDMAGLKDGEEALKDRIAEFERKTRSIVEGLPDPLKDKLQALIDAIPENPEEEDKDKPLNGARFQRVVGILDAVNKFHAEVVTSTETRVVGRVQGRDQEAIVTTVYLGISQAFFVTQNGEKGGKGMPAPQGWNWTALDDQADRESIARTIRILQNKEPAGYVRLPVEIK